jgi:hypothetical protein
MVGRSGSSAGVEPVAVGVLDAVGDVPEFDVPESDVPEPDVSEVRRFMVGRSGSVLVVPDVVVVSGLLWSLPPEDAGSVGFEPKWGRFGSAEAAMAGRVFDGFRAVAVFRGAERGLTLP